jgi:hypothetical protein
MNVEYFFNGLKKGDNVHVYNSVDSYYFTVILSFRLNLTHYILIHSEGQYHWTTSANAAIIYQDMVNNHSLGIVLVK